MTVVVRFNVIIVKKLLTKGSQNNAIKGQNKMKIVINASEIHIKNILQKPETKNQKIYKK